MPAKKKPAAKAAAPKNPATAAHQGGMDPDVEAKRSGPPSAGPAMPKPLAPLDADPAVGHPVSDAEGEANSQRIEEIEAKLKDPSFDPSGEERLRLAEESRSLPGRPYPNTTDVDTHGDPATDEPKR